MYFCIVISLFLHGILYFSLSNLLSISSPKNVASIIPVQYSVQKVSKSQQKLLISNRNYRKNSKLNFSNRHIPSQEIHVNSESKLTNKLFNNENTEIILFSKKVREEIYKNIKPDFFENLDEQILLKIKFQESHLPAVFEISSANFKAKLAMQQVLQKVLVQEFTEGELKKIKGQFEFPLELSLSIQTNSSH